MKRPSLTQKLDINYVLLRDGKPVAVCSEPSGQFVSLRMSQSDGPLPGGPVHVLQKNERVVAVTVRTKPK
jgi:hypothetical protein